VSLRVGLIGRGMAGTVFHAPLIRAVPRLELAAIAGSADAAAVVANPEIDLVVIATPNLTHFGLAEAALRAGKHVVVDKPFTVTVAEADTLIDLARAKGKVLTVFHNRRWDGDFLTVREVIGRLGEVMLAEMRWDRFRAEIKPGWREVPAEGAGLLSDLGPHMIDQALLLFGRPDAVSADLASQRAAAAVDDYFELALHYGPRRVLISAATLVAAPRPRFALHGTGGSFVKYGVDPQEQALKEGAVPGDDLQHGTLTLPDGTSALVPTVRGDYRLFYEGVAAAILAGAPPPVDPADARAGLELIALARQSAREGRRIAL
jgi:scyllo-inositol 2-dehydrogenase (NADP+)